MTGGVRALFRWRFMPDSATPDATTLLAAKAVRAFGDGFVAVLLPLYLTTLGYGGLEVGAIATTTLVGSAALTLLVGMISYQFRRQRLLVYASLLMVFSGLGFTFLESFWPLLLVAFVGTLNPSANDVSVFLPIEQTLLPQTVSDRERTAVFARYTLIGMLVAAIGSLCSGLPDLAVEWWGIDLELALKGMFLLYAVLGLASFAIYQRLSPDIEPQVSKPRQPLGKSRRTVYGLAALFSLDAFGGGFVVQSLLALWLFEQFAISSAAAGTIFFWANTLAAFSALISARISQRIGLVNTMAFTHLPAQIALILVPFMPNLWLALLFLLIRFSLSVMDVAPRNSYVMAVVSPEERPAAASVTSVPRSLAAAGSPVLAGYMLNLTTFGLPLIAGGVLKIIYDFLLLHQFRKVKPPEEMDE